MATKEHHEKEKGKERDHHHKQEDHFRHSASGHADRNHGQPKKGGGGKGNWGKEGEDDGQQELDPRDPNYDPDEQGAKKTNVAPAAASSDKSAATSTDKK